MSNVLAIAQKELKAYFASPIAYVVIAFFAGLYGYFYVVMLSFFQRVSLQMQMGGQQTANVNEIMIRPLMQNVLILILFIMPMVTMRTYAEEKRAGTIELLLTSPLTDWQIVLGKFVGALFVYGNPEWKPIATAYLGLFLFGGCFISVGMFISSLTKNQIIAGMATFGVFLFLWIINWIGSFYPSIEKLTNYLSVVQHADDFWKGVLDTTHLIYYVSFMAFGLFLTARSVDTERWRG
jgi:gliding motility-associated transport system permease protein